MSLSNPDVILFDINGNPYGVSGSMPLPVGAIGQLIAGVDNSVSGTTTVTYLSMSNGALVVTGTVNSTVTFPSVIGVDVENWPAVFGVSGSVNVYTSGPQAVSGTVGAVVENWPAVLGVSGSQLTGSTFAGFPVVAGGVYSNSVGYRVTALETDSSGALYVTTSGSLPVTFAGTVPVIVENWPAVVGVSGSVNAYTSGPQGITGSVNVYTSGPQAVSGTVSIVQPVEVWNFAPVAVSGSYVSGTVATAPVSPVLEGGLDTLNVVRPFLTDPQGRLTNPVTGSNVTSVAASQANQTALFPNRQRVLATFWNEGSANCYLKFGQVASKSSYTVLLGTKAYYELPVTYQGQVDVLFDGNTGNLRITELS